MIPLICLFAVSQAVAQEEQDSSVSLPLYITIGPLFSAEGGSGIDFGIGYQLNKNLGVEARISYIGESDYGADSLLSGVSSAGNPNALSVGGNLIYSFDVQSPLKPYVIFGVQSLRLSNFDVESSSELSLRPLAGVGLRYWLNSRVSLRGEVEGLIDVDSNELDQAAILSLSYSLGLDAGVDRTDIDTDGDGVRDSDDQCPTTPSGVQVNRIGCSLDDDGDGVANYLDACSDTLAGTTVDSRGCPLDTDGDGIVDADDRCPNTTPGVDVDVDGCRLLPERIIVLKVLFGFDLALVEAGQLDTGLVNTFVEMLRRYPRIRVQLQGHTDNTGPAWYNRELSILRADRVKEYLVSGYGINPDRISVTGYGSGRPVTSNATEQGRQQNRRVESRLLD